MPFRPLLRSLALPLAAGLLSFGLACKGKKSTATASTSSSNLVAIKGTVTFDRIPVVRDAAGLPLGLETNPTKFQTNLPARNVRVVLYEEVHVQDKDSNGNPITKVFYRVPTGAEGLTAKDGTFTLAVSKGVNYMIEIQSSVTVGNGSSANNINITADPAGMASTVPVVNRLRYCYRVDLAGNTPPTTPGVNHVAASAIQADTTLNIHIGVGATWFLADTDLESNGGLPITRIAPAYSPGSPLYAEAGQAESSPSGSKIIGILDSIATFSYCEGIDGFYFPIIYGSNLDLNYLPGFVEPKGTYVEFNRGTYPLTPGPAQQNVAYDPYSGTIRFLGALSGAPDMGWDEGEILALMARCNMFSQFLPSALFAGDVRGTVAPPPTPVRTALPDLHPNFALVEGLPELMAALIQKNPYIGLAGRDVRDISGLTPAQKTIYSAPLVRALGWQAALLEHGITSPGTPTEWANIKINNMRAYLAIGLPATGTDTQNLYLQLAALSKAGTTAAGATPSSIFTDAAIQNLLSSAPLSVPAGNIPWPRPASGPLSSLNAEWGSNPSGTLPDLTLSMAKATQVGGVYPNLSQGELVYAHMVQTGVKQYQFSVSLLNGTAPATLTNGLVEVTFISSGTPSGTEIQTFTFASSTPSPLNLILEGKPGVDGVHFIRIRMLSPTTVQPDTTVRISLVPQT